MSAVIHKCFSDLRRAAKVKALRAGPASRARLIIPKGLVRAAEDHGVVCIKAASALQQV